MPPEGGSAGRAGQKGVVEGIGAAPRCWMEDVGSRMGALFGGVGEPGAGAGDFDAAEIEPSVRRGRGRCSARVRARGRVVDRDDGAVGGEGGFDAVMRPRPACRPKWRAGPIRRVR